MPEVLKLASWPLDRLNWLAEGKDAASEFNSVDSRAVLLAEVDTLKLKGILLDESPPHRLNGHRPCSLKE